METRSSEYVISLFMVGFISMVRTGPRGRPPLRTANNDVVVVAEEEGGAVVVDWVVAAKVEEEEDGWNRVNADVVDVVVYNVVAERSTDDNFIV